MLEHTQILGPPKKCSAWFEDIQKVTEKIQLKVQIIRKIIVINTELFHR